MTEHRDVDEIKELVALACEICDAGMVIAADGHLGLSDVAQLWSVIERIGPAFIGIKNIPGEVADLTPKECDEIIAFIESDLDAVNGNARIVLDKVLHAAKACYEVYTAVRSM